MWHKRTRKILEYHPDVGYCPTIPAELFTAAIVSNIESVQQTLNLTLDAAYGHMFLPVEALIWIRSL